MWQEHCVECAAPECYATCSLYAPRADQVCARFQYGIYPNEEFEGLLGYGADVRFRRWAKIWTPVFDIDVSPDRHSLLDRSNKRLFDVLGPVERALIPMPASPKPRKSALAGTRRRVLDRFAREPRPGRYDEFVLNCYSPESDSFRLKLSYAHENGGAETVVFQESFEIEPGWNLHTLPASRFPFGDGQDRTKGTLWLSVDKDEERRVIFTWLDFVKYRGSTSADAQPTPAAKVKCVAWDLDNTLWHGILVEDGAAGLKPRREALELIRELDERGIIQTIVSKNDLEPAMAVVDDLGLRDYFLYPAINWGAKSDNLKQIADKLNINIDTFAVIDDSPFERGEIGGAIPQLRVYTEEQIPDLLGLDEFDVPITEASKGRRQTYLDNIDREQSWEATEGSYDEFLRSCELRARFFVPRSEKEVERSLELISRTNQLNLSSRRHSRDEFEAMLAREDTLCLGIDCGDRFGEYGIVGIATVELGEDGATLVDFCLSCRVARKKVEHALMHWLAGRALARGEAYLHAEVRRTERNGALFQVFEEMPFELVSNDGDRFVYRLPASFGDEVQDFVDVRDEATAGDSGAAEG